MASYARLSCTPTESVMVLCHAVYALGEKGAHLATGGTGSDSLVVRLLPRMSIGGEKYPFRRTGELGHTAA